jgi:hypothetical protein
VTRTDHDAPDPDGIYFSALTFRWSESGTLICIPDETVNQGTVEYSGALGIFFSL